MTFKDISKWNTRVSIVYAVGVWTMIGSYAYYKHTGRYDELAEKKEEDVKKPENPNQVVYETPHNKTTIIYKEDFVPYTTRIYNFIKSFSKEPGTGDDQK